MKDSLTPKQIAAVKAAQSSAPAYSPSKDDKLYTARAGNPYGGPTTPLPDSTKVSNRLRFNQLKKPERGIQMPSKQPGKQKSAAQTEALRRVATRNKIV